MRENDVPAPPTSFEPVCTEASRRGAHVAKDLETKKPALRRMKPLATCM